MGQYFTNEKLPSNMHDYQVGMFGHLFTFTTDNGVFSKRGLDFGTRVLLENIPLTEVHGEVLDLGCGYGVVGVILGKVTEAKLTMCDVNRRALHLSRRNLEKNGVTSATVLESDVYAGLKDQKFDLIITNPPIRAGKKVVYDFLLGARDHLSKKGALYFVVRKEQGAKSILSDMEKYYHVSIVNKIKGFFVIRCDFD